MIPLRVSSFFRLGACPSPPLLLPFLLLPPLQPPPLVEPTSIPAPPDNSSVWSQERPPFCQMSSPKRRVVEGVRREQGPVKVGGRRRMVRAKCGESRRLKANGASETWRKDGCRGERETAAEARRDGSVALVLKAGPYGPKRGRGEGRRDGTEYAWRQGMRIIHLKKPIGLELAILYTIKQEYGNTWPGSASFNCSYSFFFLNLHL
jgi:hypothetical protein